MAALLSALTPLQHGAVGAAEVPLRYGMHAARSPVTCPHEIAASAIGATIMNIIKTTHATFMLAIVFLKKNL